MDKAFAKYMKWGKLVKSSWTDEIFKLVEDMSVDKATVLAVNMSNWRRYDILRAWLNNWEKDKSFRERFTGNIEDCKREKLGYEEKLKIADIVPANEIRFITPHYDTLFSVADFSMVKLDGVSKRVVYIDDCHFEIEGGLCYHICEFAELCQRDGKKVEPVLA